MNSYPSAAQRLPGGLLSWPRRAEAWLDGHGRKAWITAMVLGFIFFWPVGLALIAYMTMTNRWSKDMFGSSCRKHRHGQDGHHQRHWGDRWSSRVHTSSGNAAFDAYKAETLRRLEDEQAAFEGFLNRLREAKDKTEFDAFMDERARTPREAGQLETPSSQG